MLKNGKAFMSIITKIRIPQKQSLTRIRRLLISSKGRIRNQEFKLLSDIIILTNSYGHFHIFWLYSIKRKMSIQNNPTEDFHLK